jgi:hypothetical protein
VNVVAPAKKKIGADVKWWVNQERRFMWLAVELRRARTVALE